MIKLVEASTESVLNPMHEAAKRGNLDFLKECLSNNVQILYNLNLIIFLNFNFKGFGIYFRAVKNIELFFCLYFKMI